MAIVRSPKKFTDEFSIPLSTLQGAGLFDPVLNADTPLFIDPLLVGKSANPILAARGEQKIRDRFSNVYKLISLPATSVTQTALNKLLKFNEIASNCLGYTAGGISGHGMGPAKRDSIIYLARQIREVGRVEPTLIPLLAVLESGIGADLISDMTTNIIIEELAEITSKFAADNSISVENFELGTRSFKLPRNRYINKRVPIVLVPNDILRDLPRIDSWEDLFNIGIFNANLRDRVNEYVGHIFEDEELYAHEKREKAAEEIRKNNEAVARVAEYLATVPTEVYDVVNDPKTKRALQRIVGIVETEFPLEKAWVSPATEGEFFDLVREVVDQFAFLVEHRGLWKLLWDKGKRLREDVPQRVFFAAAYSYLHHYDVHVGVEHDTGEGKIDFIFTKGKTFQVVVEMKWSDNNLLRGYERQIDRYMKSQKANRGIYVVLDCDGGESYEAVQSELAVLTAERGDVSVKLIDANQKASPSKPPL